MTQEEQKQFIEDVLDGLRETLIEDLLPRVPRHWDGRELRSLIADTLRERYVYQQLIPRSYARDRMIHNL